MTQLRAVDIAHRFGRRVVLRSVTLNCVAGECAVLYGANGSGKSTLLSLLATRLRIQQGHCHIDDLDIKIHGEAARKRTLFIGHHSHLYGHLSPLENLIFFRDIYQLDVGREELIEAIAKVGLAPFIHQPVRWFSAGMKKRLSLARILAGRPAVLLLDEPYSALDHEGVRWLNGVIDTFQKQGGLVVLASHDPERVAALNHTPWRLDGGVLQPVGETQ
ncbi:MAG: heme exporter protein CcmA [Magnetococcales bacterium]|nr:heme exporter protein CcmA [Magnetococcales bacterium]HIJ85101.1 heme ABC exporter ATP-binding protein CcmA [Magnetococcales bacterium]